MSLNWCHRSRTVPLESYVGKSFSEHMLELKTTYPNKYIVACDQRQFALEHYGMDTIRCYVENDIIQDIHFG